MLNSKVAITAALSMVGVFMGTIQLNGAIRPLDDWNPQDNRLVELKELKRRDLLEMRPRWADSVTATAPNSSFFLVYKFDPAPSLWKDFNENILDQGKIVGLRTQYYDILRDWQWREDYDLVNRVDIENHQARLSSFADLIFRQVISYQFTEGVRKAEAVSEEIRTFRKVQYTMKRVARASVNVNVEDKFKMKLKSDIPKLEANLGIETPVAGGFVELRLGEVFTAFEEESPEELLRRNRGRPIETLKVGINRGIPIVNVGAGVEYGFTSTNVRANFDKRVPVPGDLRVRFTVAQALDEETSYLPEGGEQQIEFLYRFRF